MESKFYIKALTDEEILTLLNERKFNILRPVKCNHCDNVTDFQQKIFRVDFKSPNIDQDERQNILRYHMKQNYKFESIFFKIRDNIHYIDTAFCKKCSSNLITYDIKLGDEEFEEISNFLNIPKEKLRLELRKLNDSLL